MSSKPIKSLLPNGSIRFHSSFNSAANYVKYDAHGFFPEREHRTYPDVRPSPFHRWLFWRQDEAGTYRLLGLVTLHTDHITSIGKPPEPLS